METLRRKIKLGYMFLMQGFHRFQNDPTVTHVFDNYSFANANVLLVLGELMGGDGEEDGQPSRSAIPLVAGAIVLAQLTMVRLKACF